MRTIYQKFYPCSCCATFWYFFLQKWIGVDAMKLNMIISTRIVACFTQVLTRNGFKRINELWRLLLIAHHKFFLKRSSSETLKVLKTHAERLQKKGRCRQIIYTSNFFYEFACYFLWKIRSFLSSHFWEMKVNPQ